MNVDKANFDRGCAEISNHSLSLAQTKFTSVCIYNSVLFTTSYNTRLKQLT